MVFAERSEIDARPASAEDLRKLALTNYGHFTTLQVRGGRARGLKLHLQRLQTGNRELFGPGLDEEQLRQAMRHVLLDTTDATLRINVFSRDGTTALRGEPVTPVVMVTVRAPAESPGTPMRVRTFRYEREPAHLKHVGAMGLLYFSRQARLAGFDDALFVHATAGISEGSTWNIGFHDEHGVIWPDAPVLHGITRQLLEAALHEAGIPSRVQRVGLDQLGDFRGTFALNSSTIVRPVVQIDDIHLATNPAWLERLRGYYADQPWETI